MHLPEVTMYTDGACSPNPGVGGWGVVLISADGSITERSGRVEETTNNRMELSAALYALQGLKQAHKVTLVTDSTYVKNGITSWIHGWRRRDWLTADKQPVKNRDLWELLSEEMDRHTVTWKWIKGHALNRWNERADALAVAARSTIAAKSPPALSAPAENTQRIQIFSGITFAPSRQLGSWAVIFSYQQYVKVLAGAGEGSSANQFHLLAALASLSALKRDLPVTLFTTSGYLRDGIDRWLQGWKQRDWQTREGKPVSNRDLWQQLDPLLHRFTVDVQVVSRKDGFCLMQEAKELAREWQPTG